MTTQDDTIRRLIQDVAKLEQKVQRLSTRDSAGGYWLSFQAWSSIPGAGNAATNGNAFLLGIPRDLTLKKIVIPAFTQTTNDATNYWSFTVSDGVGNTILSGQDFHLDTVNTWTVHNYTSFTMADVPQSGKYIVLGCTKVGAPGNFYFGNPCIFFV